MVESCSRRIDCCSCGVSVRCCERLSCRVCFIEMGREDLAGSIVVQTGRNGKGGWSAGCVGASNLEWSSGETRLTCSLETLSSGGQKASSDTALTLEA